MIPYHPISPYDPWNGGGIIGVWWAVPLGNNTEKKNIVSAMLPMLPTHVRYVISGTITAITCISDICSCVHPYFSILSWKNENAKKITETKLITVCVIKKHKKCEEMGGLLQPAQLSALAFDGSYSQTKRFMDPRSYNATGPKISQNIDNICSIALVTIVSEISCLTSEVWTSSIFFATCERCRRCDLWKPRKINTGMKAQRFKLTVSLVFPFSYP